MTDEQTTAQLPPPPPERPRRLTRSRDDRVLAGVAGGLGSYFGVDPVIVRIAFAVSVFFGGLGAVAYIALALFVPTAAGADGEQRPAPVERSRWLAVGLGIGVAVIALSWGVFDGPFWGHGFWFSPVLFIVALAAGAILLVRRGDGSGRAQGTAATVLLAIAAFIGLTIVALAAAWAAATGHGVAVALVVIGIGALLVIAAFNGGARWLIAPAIAIAIPLGAVAASGVSFGDGIGERVYRPLAVDSIPDDGYELGIGHLVVDLRQLDWTDATVVDLNVDLGIGQAVVGVPSNVCVTADFDARAGSLEVAGDQTQGADVHSDANAGAAATPRLELTGQVDLGQLQVLNDDDAELDGQGPRFGSHDNEDEMRAAMTAACSGASTTAGADSPNAVARPDAPEAPSPPGGGHGHGRSQDKGSRRG